MTALHAPGLREELVAALEAARGADAADPQTWRVRLRELLLYLGEAERDGSRELLLEFVAWAKGRCFAEGRDPAELAADLAALQTILAERTELGPEPVRLLAEACAAFGGLEPEPPTFLVDGAPLVDVARRYLEELLAFERQAAVELVLEGVADGAEVQDVFLHVLQPVQREVGRLWQLNHIGMAVEHYCTATTQLVLGRLERTLFEGPRNGRRLVCATVGSDAHEVGLLMVADLFEADGWDTVFLGSSVPREEVVATVARVRPDLLGLSVTLGRNLPALERTIAAVRGSGVDVPILVGGRPFLGRPGLAASLEADLWADDAVGAVDVARRHVRTPS